MLLIFEGRYVFIPQSEIQSVEIIADVQIAPTPFGAIGWFGQGEESPIFCLNGNFSLIAELPKKCEYFVLLKAPQHPIGITCEEVEDVNFQKEHLYPHNLPMVMRTPTSPVKQLLIYQGKVGYVCQGAALVNYIGSLAERLLQTEAS
jgi:hypothetical protein